MSGATNDDQVAAVLRSQKEFYNRRAPDYMDASKPIDRKAWGGLAPEVARQIIESLGPVGDAVEFACGAGFFTRWLAPAARSVTALDSSPAMLERNRREVAYPSVVYVNADLFDWTPEARYDLVFFGFWLSHVPPSMFEPFWALVRKCLTPDGRVAFVDEDDRARGVVDDTVITGGIPIARRVLGDGTQFGIVKVFWSAEELADRLGQLGWDVRVNRLGDMHLHGVGRRRLT